VGLKDQNKKRVINQCRTGGIKLPTSLSWPDGGEFMKSTLPNHLMGPASAKSRLLKVPAPFFDHKMALAIARAI
jgi:hypothetical protein